MQHQTREGCATLSMNDAASFARGLRNPRGRTVGCFLAQYVAPIQLVAGS